MSVSYENSDSAIPGHPGSRVALTTALCCATEIFTSYAEETFDAVMTNGLQPIAEAIGVNRINVFCLDDADGEKRPRQAFRWDIAEGGATPESSLILPSGQVVSEWQNSLLQGALLNLCETDCSESEKAFLASFGIKSIFIVPIFTHGELWGCVSFQDHFKARRFDEEGADLVKAAAQMIALTVIRDGMTQSTKKTNEALKQNVSVKEALFKLATLFLSQGEKTFDEKMADAIGMIADLAAIDRFSLWRNSDGPGGLCASQIYRWDSLLGGTVPGRAELANIPYALLDPKLESLFAENDMINGPASLGIGAAMMQKFGILSALVAPVYINNSLWGFVLFADTKCERRFDSNQAEMMRSAGAIFADNLIRREIEKEADEALDLYTTLFNASPMGLALIGESQKFFDCNETLLKMFGITKQHYINHFHKLSPECQPDGIKSADKMQAMVNHALGGEKVVAEWMHCTPDGELIPCEVSLVPARQKDKCIALGYVYDLRNIKKMEVALSESASQLHAITETSPISYILFDEDLHPIDCNEATLAIFACSDKRHFLDHYSDFAPEYQPDGQKSHDRGQNIKDRVLSQGKMVYEWHHVTQEGEPLQVENTIMPIIISSKKYIICYKYDLRNIKKMEAALNESAAQLNAITETSPISYILFDADLRPLDCNEATLAIFACSDKQHFLDHYSHFAPEYQPDGQKSSARGQEIRRKVLSEGKLVYEWHHITQDGELLQVENTIMPIIISGKKYIICFKYDLRNIKKMEAALNESTAQLNAITGASPISYILFGEDLRPIDCNEATLAIFGCKDKQYFLERYSDLAPEYQPDGQKSSTKGQEIRRRVFSEGKVVYEWHHTTLKGDLLQVENTIMPLIINEKRYIICFKYDLRNIKKMEKALTDAEELTRVITGKSPFPYILFDKEMRILDCNDTAVRVFGCHTKKELFDNYWNRFSPEYQPDGQKTSEKAVALRDKILSEGTVVYEWQNISSAGEPILFENTSTLMIIQGEKCWVSFKYDLRNIKKMEKAVSNAETMTRTITETSPVAYILFSEDLKPLDCNDLTLKVFDCDDKLYFLDHYSDFAPEYQPDGQKSHASGQEIRRKVLSQGKMVYEWLHTTQNGDLLQVENTIMPIIINEKKYIICFKYDLRNIKKMEKALTDAETLNRTITEASPVSYILFSKDMQPLDCNDLTLKVFACQDKKYFLENYWARFSPEYQPDGSKSSDKFHFFKDASFAKEKTIFEWVHLSQTGELIPMENTVASLIFNNEKYLVSFKYDLRRIKHLESEAEKVYIDALTGIYNRRYFDENLNSLLKSLSRFNGTLSLMLIDIDCFKKYNDTYGHIEGDRCLKEVAVALTHVVCRGDDFVARYGGEEFAVILPGTNEDGAHLLAEKMLENVRNCKIIHEKNDAHEYVTISVGAVAGRVGHTLTAEAIIRAADELLYKAKQGGRNRCFCGSYGKGT
jgi:diguanylate cyclase (GGDEF)-like protein/PAS domain S-box-containing protein